MDDWTLLDEFVRTNSQKAFEELVHRHGGLVFASAVRRAGSRHAEDITQAVFILLARKAAHLRRGPSQTLAGWLYKATRYATSEAIRKDKRRMDREHAAGEHLNMTAHANNDTPPTSDVLSVLDAALDRLGQKDRDAVVLRYLKGAAYAEVGEALGLSENAATKRVARAIEKLRAVFTRKGIAVSAAALTAVLTTESAVSVPAGVAAGSIAAALTAGLGTATAATSAALADGAGKLIAAAQAKTAVTVGCAVLVATAGVVLTARKFLPLPPPSLRVVRVTPFPLLYRGRNTLPNGNVQFQLNTAGNRRTYFAKQGEKVEGFQLVGHTTKSVTRFVPELRTAQTTDVSELSVRRGDVTTTLTLGTPAQEGLSAVLHDRAGDVQLTVKRGERFTLDGQSFECVAVDPARSNVVVRRLSDDLGWVISRDGTAAKHRGRRVTP